MSDKITVLESLGPVLTKRYLPGDKTIPYEDAASYHFKEVEVGGLKGVAALLGKLHKNPLRCLIRGKFVGEDKAQPGNVEGTWTRTNANFDDQPLHWFMVDIDAFVPFAADPVTEPVEAVKEFITAVLPPCFRDCSFYWHLSSSAGMPGKESFLKCHVHFWSKTAYTTAQMNAWAKQTSRLIDSAIFRRVQVHYTADPIFKGDRIDPVAVRAGWYQGERDEVDLVIGEDTLAQAREQGAGTGSGDMKVTDPSEKDGLIGLFHRAFDAEDVLLTLLDEFEQVNQRRYTWLNGGGTPEGVWVHDDGLHVASSHNTWPIDGLANLWDVVRVFKFGHLDHSDDDFEQLNIDTAPIGARPSDKAMYAWADTLEGIKEARREEREGPFLRCKALIDEAQSVYELETDVAPLVRAEELQDSDRVRLVKALQTRYKAVDPSGATLPVAMARRWLAPERTALVTEEGEETISPAAPEWAKPWVWVNSRDVFIHRVNKEEVTTTSFNAMHTRNMAPFADENGRIPKAADWCLNVWRMRTVSDAVYSPPNGEFFHLENRLCINTYRPDLLPEEPRAYSQGDLQAIEILKDHLRLLLPNERERNILLDWMAYNVQKPGGKIRWSPLLIGFPGDGKSAFLNLMARVLGSKNVRILNNRTLESGFTGWASGQGVIGIEELKMHNHNRYDIFNGIKDIISNTEIEIHPKGKDPYNIPNYSNVIMLSNYLDAAPASNEDRRLCYLKTPFIGTSAQNLEAAITKQTGLTSEAYFARLFDGAFSEHAGALRRWLREHQLSNEFNPNGRAPVTDLRGMAIDLSRGDLDEAIESLLTLRGEGIYPNLVSTGHLSRAIRNQYPHIHTPQGRTLRAILLGLGWLPFEKRSVRWGGEICTWYYRGEPPAHPSLVASELETERLNEEIEREFQD